jgi:O-succinylbenzoic acid--CoA ligase
MPSDLPAKRRKNAHVQYVPDGVEIAEAPRNPEAVQRFLPRLARALAGGAPLMTVPLVETGRETLPPGHGRGGLAMPWDTALVVPTSGSTGDPRHVILSRGALTTSADLTHAALGGPGRWLLALPTTHIAGLQVLVRSVRAGLSPEVLDLDASFTAERFAAAVEAMDVSSTEHPHYTALVPTQLQRLVDDGSGLEALWQLDAVLVGGGSVSPSLVDRARDAGVTVVRTYGMTETCGGCVYDGVPLEGVEVDIEDEAGDGSSDGRIRIRGAVLFDGYLDGAHQLSDDGWFVTNDFGRIDDGVLTVEGRIDQVVISGGVKVPAESVERALVELRYVDDALVVGVADAEWGERVVAVVTSASDVDVAQVRAELRGQMPDAWLPRTVIRLPAMPLLASGKPDRVAVQRVVADLAR